jgi:hypothetical protein
MNYIKSITLLAGFSLLTLTSCQKDNALNQAQIGDTAQMEELISSSRKCDSHEHNEELMAKDPQFKKNQAQIEEFTSRFMANYDQKTSTRTVVNIPVVVHVVYKTAAENISQAQVQSQIDVLNADFRKLNADVSLTPSIFAGLPADCEINFVLEQTIRKSTTKIK